MRINRTLKNTIYYITFLITAIYIVYRVFYTVPNDNLVNIIFGVLILIIELIETFFYTIYFFNVLIRKRNTLELPKIKDNEYPDIDVFIATINEDKSLIKETITKCKNMKYPDSKKVHIYLCDDGRRKEMKELCKELDINYIDRKDNKDAKAGNYNNALSKTSSPYIAVFDADMHPEPNFLLRTVPYIVKDKKIGFVQTPQNFRNPDIYQSRYKITNVIPHEQNFFFNEINMAKCNTNSVIYCGTNAVLSREALEKVGGFATQSVTEDLATGLLIEANGYKGIGINEKLAFGLNVNNLDSYTKQKSRWCRGNLQSFKNYKLFTNKGLNISQKLEYFSTLFYWTYGIRHIFYLTIPLLFPLFGIRLIRGNYLIFIILFFTQYILKRLVTDKLEGNKMSSTWNRLYETVLFPSILLDILREIFHFGSRKFYVSPKKKEKNTVTRKNLYLLLTHTLFFIVTLVGIIFTIYRARHGITDYYLVTLFWLLSNIFYLGYTIIFDLSFKDQDIKVDKNKETYSLKAYFIIIYKFIKEELNIVKTLILSLIVIISILLSHLLIVNYINSNKFYMKGLVSRNGWLRVEENNIINEKGEKVVLRGVSSHHLYYFGHVYNRENLKNLKENWGVNAFRIAVFTEPTINGYISKPETINQVKELVDICIDLDMYVIIDWHILSDNNPNTYKEEAIEFFDELSKEYKDYPNVIYEICNEPNGDEVTWDKDIKPYAEDLIKVIRNNSKKAIIIVGTATWSKDTVSVIKNPIEEDNIMYALHIYLGDDLLTVAKYLIIAVNNKLPIIITECAATNGSGDGTLYLKTFKRLIYYLEGQDISWFAWQLSDKEESSSILVNETQQKILWKKYNVYNEKELSNKKYDLNDYLTEEGKIIKGLIYRYTKLNYQGE